MGDRIKSGCHGDIRGTIEEHFKGTAKLSFMDFMNFLKKQKISTVSRQGAQNIWKLVDTDGDGGTSLNFLCEFMEPSHFAKEKDVARKYANAWCPRVGNLNKNRALFIDPEGE